MKKNKSKLLASIASITLSLGAIALPNIPAEAYTGKVTLVGDVGSRKVELIRALSERDPELESSLWDTAGQEEYLSLLPSSLRNANVVIITVNLGTPDNISSSINRWASRVDGYCNAEIIVVGTNPNINYNDDYALLENAVRESIIPNARFFVADAYAIEDLQTFIVSRFPREEQEQQPEQRRSEITINLGDRIRRSLQNLREFVALRFPPEQRQALRERISDFFIG